MDTKYTISVQELESIEQYLLGAISPGERILFENKMAENALWAAKVREVELLLVGIETASLKDSLNAYHAGIKKNTTHQPAKLFFMGRKLAVAASVALLAGLGVWLFTMNKNKYEKLYTVYYKPDPGLISAMSTGNNYLFNKAMLDYKTGQYKKAISEWSQLQSNQPQNDTLNYFLGVAQQADGNDVAALNFLRSVAADETRPFYKDACWYTGLALLKQGKVQEALPYFEKSARPESTGLIKKLK